MNAKTLMLGIPLLLTIGGASRGAPTVKENGFDLYLKADAAFKPGAPPVDEAYDKEAARLTAAQKAERYSPARHQAWLKQNAAAFALFDKARAADSRHPIFLDPDSPRDIPYIAFRRLARYKLTQAHTFEFQGKWRQAADARLDAIEMGADISRGGPMLPLLIRYVVDATALLDFSQGIRHLNATDSFQVGTRLNWLVETTPSLVSVLEAEHQFFRRALNETWDKPAEDEDDERAKPPGLLKEVILARNERLTKRFVAEYAKPVKKRISIAAPGEKYDPVNFDHHDRLTHLALGIDRDRIIVQTAQLQLALRSYRAQTGAYPASLQAVAPKYLAVIPADPYGGGEPWRYKKNGDSYRLWSLGPDGKDDGGKPIPSKTPGKPAVVFDDSIGDALATP